MIAQMKQLNCNRAKVNFSYILGKRDGFHNIQSIFQTINLFDTLTFTLKIQVLECDCVDLNKNNIIIKTWDMLASKNIKRSTCLIKKNIPVGSGLGGVLNAAVTLFIMDKFNLQLSRMNLSVAKTLGQMCLFSWMVVLHMSLEEGI